jgi:hypothetical protein
VNIQFDHQIFCLQRYGGISRYFCELASHIANSPEQEIEIFAPLFINEYLSSSGIGGPRGLKKPELSGFGKAVAWGIDRVLAFAFLRAQSGVDVFHETYHSEMDSCPRSIKRIISVFDMAHDKFPGMQSGRDKIRNNLRRH